MDTPAPTPSRTVYYTEVKLDSTDDPKRLDLVRAQNSPDPPDEVTALWRDISEVSRTANVLFASDKAKRVEFYRGLHVAAYALCRADYNVKTGRLNLEEVKRNIASQFPAVRDFFWGQYFKFLTIVALTLGLLGAGAYYSSVRGFYLPPPDTKGNFDAVAASVIAFCWIPVGASLGIFIEFIFRIGDRDISFEDLQSINPGRWNPRQRLVNTAMTAYCFGALMGIGAFQIGVATVLLNEFASAKPYLSIAVGFVTGLAFPYVRDIIYQFRPVRKEI